MKSLVLTISISLLFSILGISKLTLDTDSIQIYQDYIIDSENECLEEVGNFDGVDWKFCIRSFIYAQKIENSNNYLFYFKTTNRRLCSLEVDNWGWLDFKDENVFDQESNPGSLIIQVNGGGGGGDRTTFITVINLYNFRFATYNDLKSYVESSRLPSCILSEWLEKKCVQCSGRSRRPSALLMVSIDILPTKVFHAKIYVEDIIENGDPFDPEEKIESDFLCEYCSQDVDEIESDDCVCNNPPDDCSEPEPESPSKYPTALGGVLGTMIIAFLLLGVFWIVLIGLKEWLRRK